jgi:diacylglycerol kinase
MRNRFLGTGVVLAAELYNTAIEALCDFVENRHDEKIRIIKDIAAATGVAVLACMIALPSMLIMMAALYFLARSIRELAGLKLTDALRGHV